jgi:hypothetical protein
MLTVGATFAGQAPAVYTPALPSIISSSESQQLQELTDAAEIAILSSAIQSHRMETDMDSLIFIHHAEQTRVHHLVWYVPMFISVGTVLIIYTV